jgi:regulator of sigma E protease
MIITIILGILGLSILVIVHELGHLICARAAGIKVEAFSVGWGPKLIAFKWKDIEWMISALPLGGYCKMAGEGRIALHELKEGDMYYGSAWRRLVAVIGGPLFSLAFAFLIAFGLGLTVSEVSATGNKIIVTDNTATQFRTGDEIIRINNKKIHEANDWMRIMAISARKTLNITVMRNGEPVSFREYIGLAPTGQAIIPVQSWVEPVITGFAPGSAAEAAGFTTGDLITAINNQPVANAYSLARLIAAGNGAPLTISYLRDGEAFVKTVTPHFNEEYHIYQLGIELSGAMKPLPFHKRLTYGISNFFYTLSLYMKSLSDLFHGAKISEAISGPIQTTYLIGQIAQNSIGVDIRNIFSVLSFISLALGIMNLLPIPLLDGGLIVLYLIEWVRGKISGPTVMKAYQIAGVIFIGILFFFALKSDITSLVR